MLLGGSVPDGQIMARLCGLTGSGVTRDEAEKVMQKLRLIAPKKVMKAANRYMAKACFVVDPELQTKAQDDIMARFCGAR